MFSEIVKPAIKAKTNQISSTRVKRKKKKKYM